MDETLVKVAGKYFILGYAAGIGAGAITGMAENLNELPMVQLNQTLNKATRFGEYYGYHSAMTASIYQLSKSISHKYIPNPIVTSSIAVGAAGAYCGSYWGIKGAIGGGITGSALGALIGYHQSRTDSTVNNLL